MNFFFPPTATAAVAIAAVIAAVIAVVTGDKSLTIDGRMPSLIDGR